MRFKLTLQTLHKPALLPFNYQYPLSSAIYKIIRSADKDFAAFLYNKGYGEGYKSFKLFTFSDIKTSFIKNGDRMQLQLTMQNYWFAFIYLKLQKILSKDCF